MKARRTQVRSNKSLLLGLAIASLVVLGAMVVFFPVKSLAFVPKMNCSIVGGPDNRQPLVVSYADNGLIWIQHKDHTCELDFETIVTDENQVTWFSYINNNIQIDRGVFKSYCQGLLSSVFSGLITTLNTDIANFQIEESSMKYTHQAKIARMGIFNTLNANAASVFYFDMKCQSEDKK